MQVTAADRWGGTERYALDIARGLQLQGWNTIAYTRDAKAVDGPFAAHGIKLLHAPLHGWLDIATAMDMAAEMRGMPPHTIFHAHRYRDAFTILLARKLARRKDIAVIATRHTIGKGHDGWLYRRVYRNLDAQIFVSEEARSRFTSTWRGRTLPFDATLTHVLHSSINIPDAPPVQEPQRGPVTAMFHGPLRKGKGLETLIDALPRLKNMRLRLRITGSGDPDYADSLRRRAQARGVMEMIDWHKHTGDPHALIKQSHFGIQPSTIPEAFGLSSIEYMANGRPQICTLHGAHKEYMTDGREALMVPPASASALADAMTRLASDATLRRRMGEAAYATFTQKLSWPRFMSRLTEIYTRAIRRKEQAAADI